MAEPVRVVWVRRDRYHDGLLDLLDDAEWTRVPAYRLDADRQRFVLGAAMLHLELGRATGADPRGRVVNRTCPTCGRPHGAPRPIAVGWSASVSHSGDIVVVALRQGGPVGVDVEEPRDVDEATMALALRPGELAWVRAEPARRARRFHLLWTGKEAVLKALGSGILDLGEVELAASGDGFVVVRLPDRVPGPVRVTHHPTPGRTACGRHRRGRRGRRRDHRKD